MLLISLGCSDLVLGIEWLVKLGNITWNFDKLTMEFHVQVSQPSLLRVSEARLTSASSKGGKCAESPPTFIERKTIEKPKETGHEEYSRFGSCIYVRGRY